ncbi:MAG: MucBP domain-containing protein [Bacteroidaceae bacterium]|nr:MucBP domain-containing protein [Bacteroidaceae bacterium]
MKKTFTLLALLCLVLAANAQVVTNRASAGSPMTYAEFLTLSGTGKHFAIVGSSDNTNFCYPNWFGFTATFVGTLTTTYLFDLEPSATGTGWYNIKRVSDNLYVSAEGGQFNASTKLDFKPVNRRSGDYAAEFSDANLHISLDNAAGNHYNLNTSNLGFRGGTGGYSTYIAYGPFNVVTVNYVDDSNTPLQSAETMIVKEGATITAPSFAGYNVDKTSETISADGTVTFTYTATSSYDYTIVVNGAVAGMTMTIKGDEISYGSSSYSTDAAVVESDVVVTFPAEYSYLTANVTISGTTITVDCEDTRWPINFSKTQTYIRDDRFITNVRIGSKTFPITNDGLNTLAYRDFTSDVLVVPAGATLVPAIGYQGQWMHGFFYVDLDNDGTFYVENPDHQTSANTEYNGELLSYANQGNALNSSHQEMPAFTMPTTPGDYRARFKLDWASTDPGGNPGADVNDVTSQNHIIANGGTIVDITLRIAAPADVTYVVVDKSNNELFRATESMAVGDVITTLPEAYQRSVFYTYDEKNETVTGDMEVTFTATKKADAPIVYTADATAPVWNFLRIRPTDSRAAYVRYDAAATPNVNLVTENPADPTAMWAFVGNPYDGFQMINKEAGTAVVLGSAIADASDSNGGTTYCSLAAPGSQTCETWFVTASSYATNGFFIYNSEGQYFNQRSATSNLTYWTGGHDLGSTFVAITPEEVYAALLTQLEDYSYGTGLNQYGLVVESIDRTTQAASIISGMKVQGYSETNLAVAKAALDGTSLNMPTGKFIKLYNAARNAWIGAAETGQHPNASTEEEAGIYYVADDGQIVSYAYGKALQNAAGAPCVASAGTDGGTFTISDAGSGTYYFYCGGYLVAWDTSSNRNSSPDDYAKFTLTEVTELPVSISAAGQRTFSLPTAWEVPAGVIVRYATREHDGLLTIEDAAETAIAANEAVILVGAEGTYNVAVATTGTELNSLLSATTPKGVSVDGSTKAYILAQQGDQVGFALLADGDRNIAGFKAYYVSTAAGDVPQFLFFDEGDVTGINSVNAAAQNGAAVYDLQGRRVNGALKGVYIVNGKKVLF